MSTILVCPAEHAPSVCAEFGPSHVLQLASPDDAAPTVPAEHVLGLRFHDVSEPRPGYKAVSREAMRAIFEFGGAWPATRPLLIQCRMGISRSTAAALAVLALRRPARRETDLARLLRAAAPCATPNPLMVALADEALNREGRLVAAARLIGRGAEYRPYRVSVLEA